MIELLRISEFYGCSESIEIAKGKNELPTTLKKGLRQINRQIKWQKRN